MSEAKKVSMYQFHAIPHLSAEIVKGNGTKTKKR